MHGAASHAARRCMQSPELVGLPEAATAAGAPEKKMAVKVIEARVVRGEMTGKIVFDKADTNSSRLEGHIEIEKEGEGEEKETLCMCLCRVNVTNEDIVNALNDESDLRSRGGDQFSRVVDSGIGLDSVLLTATKEKNDKPPPKTKVRNISRPVNATAVETLCKCFCRFDVTNQQIIQALTKE